MSHRIFPHGPLNELTADVWQVQGSHPLPIHRNMTVVRLPSAGLLLHSVVALDEVGMSALEQLGRPEIMVVPHAKHAMDAPFYKDRYPALSVACPQQSHRELAERYGLNIDGTTDEVLDGTGIVAHPVEGARFHEDALQVPLAEGVALVFNDALANDGRERPGIGGWLMSLTGVPRKGFGVSRAMRLFTTDRQAFAAFLTRLADLDIRLITVAHGAPVHTDPSDALRHAASML